MAKEKEKAITKVVGDPNWLKKYSAEDTSLQDLKPYRVVPRMKVIQSMTDQSLKKQFGEGTVIIRPGDAQVHKFEEPAFQFVAHFFFAEFCKWADLKDKSGNMLLEQSYDPAGRLAACARDRIKRKEVYPGHEQLKSEADKMYYSYVEHLRFVGVIYGDHQLCGTPCVLSFERGEFMQGKNFITALTLRKQKFENPDTNEVSLVPIPLWAQVWDLKVGYRDRGAKKWFGIDFAPSANPLIDERDTALFQAAYKELRELHNAEKLRVAGDDPDDLDEPNLDPNAANEKKF